MWWVKEKRPHRANGWPREFANPVKEDRVIMITHTHAAGDAVKKKEYQVPTNGFQVTQMVIRASLPELTSSEKLVLICLADRASFDGLALTCFPSIACIEAQTNLSRRTIQKALSRLDSLGYTSRKYRTDDTTIYTIKTERYRGRMSDARGRTRFTPRGVCGAPKKNRGKEQTKEQTLSPQTPLSGGVRLEGCPDDITKAILEACSGDKQLTAIKAEHLAQSLREKGVRDPQTVFNLAHFVQNGWGTYEGPVRLRHIENASWDLLDDDSSYYDDYELR